MVATEELAERIGKTAWSCEALGVSRATLYRRRRQRVRAARPRPKSHRALGPDERQRVLGVLHCDRFVDRAPAQIWATLLDERIADFGAFGHPVRFKSDGQFG